MNYRSVVVFGKASVVSEPGEKMEALRALSEHIIPGRWDEVRGPSPEEMKATLVLAMPLSEASAKVRTGPPIDDEEDYELSVWAGELPLRMIAGLPVSDPRLPQGVEPTACVRDYGRPAKGGGE